MEVCSKGVIDGTGLSAGGEMFLVLALLYYFKNVNIIVTRLV